VPSGLKRCAIYTRKSSEEGLEQDYNSLHAQREASEAFIRSQAGEGWRFAAGFAFLSASILGGCYYTPKPSVSRSPGVAVANTSEAQACARSCQQTHDLSCLGCGRSYTQYNGREVEQQVQACVDKVDDARDACLSTCPK